MDRQPNRFALFFAAIIAVAFSSLTMNVLEHARAANGETSTINQVVADAYKFDRQTALFRSAVAVVDTAATTMSHANLVLTTGALAGGTGSAFSPGGRCNIPVTARFSVAAATVTVRWVAENTIEAANFGMDRSNDVTLTAAASGATFGGLYTAPTYVFDSFGSPTCYLLVVTAPSSGTVSFSVGSY